MRVVPAPILRTYTVRMTILMVARSVSNATLHPPRVDMRTGRQRSLEYPKSRSPSITSLSPQAMYVAQQRSSWYSYKSADDGDH